MVGHDDVDLSVAETRFKKGSGTAGHHGVESIAEKLGTLQFWRLRVGVGRPSEQRFDIESYVLEDLSSDDLKKIDQLNVLAFIK